MPSAPSKADISSYQYRIGPGDMLNVQVWRNPELSGNFSVRPDGQLTTPLVEDLSVTGKTPTEVARMIETQLSKYLQEPVVTVVVGNYLGTHELQIKIVGQAAKPQTIAYREKMTLLDVMIMVGGLSEFAAGNRATLLRQPAKQVTSKEAGAASAAPTETQIQKYRVRLHDLLKKGDISANVDMLPGDVLIIPESWF
ncbi:MAG: hypothetical protein RLZZ502_942 [Pseudomonadota bacterium]